jgi:ABC-type lipoprotein release transport system permease subunit
MNIRIAWRNIWRNKKRTMITVSSVTLAVVLSVFTRSFQEGTYAKMIENAIGNFTGYVQVHQKDYWNDKTIDNGIVVTDTLIREILSVKDVEGINLRLEGFSLASHGNKTKGALVMGVEPQKADDMLKLNDKIISGKYIQAKDSAIVMGSKLAEYLHLTVGDTLVLLGQGHWGQSAIGAFPVKGIVKMPTPDLNRQIVLMPLSLAQNFYSFDNGVTTLVVKFKNSDETYQIKDAINARIDTTKYLAMPWQKMSPEMLQQIQSDRVGGIFMIAILYMVIAFGVFGTVLMMTEERKKEFAVMVAIGMQKTKLVLISLYEAILMNSVGVLLGIVLVIPLIMYFNVHPIQMTGEAAESIEKLGVEPVLPTILEFSIFLNNVIVILIITAVAAIYPSISILKMKVIKALRR